jgi:hypothetical protein
VIEERIAERFLAAVADEPPLGFDPDDVVTGAARRTRQRRAIAATTVATGVVVLTAVALFAANGTGQVRVGAAPTGTTETAPPHSVSKTEGPPPPPPPAFPGSDAVVRDLGETIPTVLAARVPGLHFGAPDSGVLMVDQSRRSVGGAYKVAGTTHRYVSVFVYHNASALDLAGDPAAAGGWGPWHSDTTRPDGSHLRVYGSDGAGTQGLLVVHLRTDGVIVLADTTAKPEPGKQGLIVSQDVLTAIATDARLTF